MTANKLSKYPDVIFFICFFGMEIVPKFKCIEGHIVIFFLLNVAFSSDIMLVWHKVDKEGDTLLNK